MDVRIIGKVRTMQDAEGEPLFCAKDVADTLGYKRVSEAVAQHVEKEDTVKCRTLTNGGQQQMLYVNESGLYALILGSKLDSARRFKHWVTAEVLHAIRRQGGYMVARADESDEVIMARALQIMQATLERRDKEIVRLTPHAEYARRGYAQNHTHEYHNSQGDLMTRTYLACPGGAWQM